MSVEIGSDGLVTHYKRSLEASKEKIEELEKQKRWLLKAAKASIKKFKQKEMIKKCHKEV